MYLVFYIFLLLSVAVVIIFLLTLTILKPDIFLLRREVEEEFFGI